MPDQLITTRGPKSAGELGMILPHEHIFADLGPFEEANYRDARADDVVDVMTPEVRAAKDSGVTALVDCTPVGVGRRADVVAAVSEAAELPVVAPTGIYQEPRVPDWAREAPEAQLREWMIDELTGTIEDTDVQAGWIKLSASDDGMTDTERKILRAAAAAGAETDAVIGSHTLSGDVVRAQLDVVEDAGYDRNRFVWIHTQEEPDTELHLDVAAQGTWIEYDGIGGDEPDAFYLDLVEDVLDAGLGDRLLLSQDRGWYDPSQPGGGEQKPYTYLPQEFLPALRERGADEETVRQLTHENPFRAFSR